MIKAGKNFDIDLRSDFRFACSDFDNLMRLLIHSYTWLIFIDNQGDWS